MDAWDTQKAIMDELTGGAGEGEWYTLKGSKQKTMVRPAVMCITPIGERLGRLAGISHDAGHIVAQNGFGAVWGAKNLKAVSFAGTHDIEIHDPNKLMAIRRELYERRDYKIDHPDQVPYDPYTEIHLYNIPGRGNVLGNFNYLPHRPEACEGCPSACRSIFPDTKANENYCVTVSWGRAASPDRIDMEETGRKNADLLNRWGINAWEVGTPAYLYSLYKRGLAGPRKRIDTGDLDFSKYGTHEFTKALLTKMVNREDCGYELSDGLSRAAKAWGTWDEDSTTGELLQPCYGYGEHYSLQVETDWAYNSILGERDMNEHAFNFWVYWMPKISLELLDVPPVMTAEKLAKMLSRVNDDLDPRCFDYSEENAYSDYRVECTSWYRHWTRVWTQSLTFCDWSWGGCRINLNDPFRDYFIDLDQYGCDMYEAVTGIPMTKKESYEIGRRIWNLDKAIWCMQGRHRDDEVFANYVYERPNPNDEFYPMIVDGKWTYASGKGRVIDREKFEDFKTRFYLFEGWNPDTGRPTRAALESVNLGYVADAMEKAGVLGDPVEGATAMPAAARA